MDITSEMEIGDSESSTYVGQLIARRKSLPGRRSLNRRIAMHSRASAYLYSGTAILIYHGEKSNGEKMTVAWKMTWELKLGHNNS